MALTGQDSAETRPTVERLFGWRLIPGRQLRLALGLAIVPAIFFFVAFQLTKASGPTWLSNNFENNYAYLFNSLLLVDGHNPSWVDHPGTTTQIFGAAILRVSEPRSGDQIVTAVLDNPDKFIKRIQRSLLLFATGGLWLFPWLTALRIRSYVTPLLLQLSSLLFVTLLRYTIWFSSDLMLIPWCVGALCLSMQFVHSRWSRADQARTAALAGIVCALGIVTKLSFFPIIFIVFATCPGMRNRLIAAAFCLLTSALVAIPIYPRLPTLINWCVELVSYSGHYGTGDPGFTRPDILWQGASMLVSTEPMIIWLPLLSTLVTLILQCTANRRVEAASRRPLFRTALVLLGLQTIGFILVAKHAGPHYLIPLYLSTGLNLALLYEAVRLKKRWSVPACLGGVALAGLLVWPIGGSLEGTTALLRWFSTWRKDQLAMYQRAKKLTKDDLRIDYYRSSTPEFAVFYGNAYTQYLFDNGYTKENYFGPFLERRYPNAMFALFFSPDMEFYTFTQELSPDAVAASHERFYLFGNHSDATYDKDHLMPIPRLDPKDMREIDSGGYIYLDEWIRGGGRAK